MLLTANALPRQVFEKGREQPGVPETPGEHDTPSSSRTPRALPSPVDSHPGEGCVCSVLRRVRTSGRCPRGDTRVSGDILKSSACARQPINFPSLGSHPFELIVIHRQHHETLER